jgi:tRNA threonylcarbamoyladenosine biosynthesis protein TsaE
LSSSIHTGERDVDSTQVGANAGTATPLPVCPLPSNSRWQGHWASEADTEAFAQQLAACATIANATITLHGDLGAGKTTFVRHLLRALGVQGRIKSPTYAVVEPHEALPCALMPPDQPLHIWHFDFYRFTDPREWEDAGFRELFASPGLKLVEWPEKAAGHLPRIDAEIHIQTEDMPLHAPESATPEDTQPARRVAFHALTREGMQLLAALKP